MAVMEKHMLVALTRLHWRNTTGKMCDTNKEHTHRWPQHGCYVQQPCIVLRWDPSGPSVLNQGRHKFPGGASPYVLHNVESVWRGKLFRTIWIFKVSQGGLKQTEWRRCREKVKNHWSRPITKMHGGVDDCKGLGVIWVADLPRESYL